MEVEVLGVEGAPDGAVVSIRAGSQRKQAAVAALRSSATPFRFAVGANGVNPFRVDLMQPAGSVKMALRPGAGSYQADIKAGSGKNVRVQFAVREASKRSAKAEDDAKLALKSADESDDALQAAAAIAKEYLETHQLLPFVRALIQTVVRERPRDPYDFIADQFRAASDAARGGRPPVDPSQDPAPEKAPPPPGPEVPEGEKAVLPPRDETPQGGETEATATKQAPPVEEEPAAPEKSTPPPWWAVKQEKGAEPAVCRPLLVPEEPAVEPFQQQQQPAEAAAPFALLPSTGTWLSRRLRVRPLGLRSPKHTRPALDARRSRSEPKPEREPESPRGPEPPSPPATKEEIVLAKRKAKDALVRALTGGVEEDTSDDLMGRAREALRSLLQDDEAGGEDEDDKEAAQVVLEGAVLESAKMEARAVLDEAVKARRDGDEDLKEEAQALLQKALLPAEREADVDKLQAQSVLDTVLEGQEKLAAQAVLDSNLSEGAEEEDSKEQARYALDALIMGGGGTGELEAEKHKAQCVLDRLFSGELDPIQEEEEEELMKTAAKDVLAATLMDEGPPPLPEGDEIARARAALDAAMGADQGLQKASMPYSAEDDERLRAQAILDASLGLGQDEDEEASKQAARAVLDRATTPTAEDEKLYAQAALERAFTGQLLVDEDEDEEACKQYARVVLEKATTPTAEDEKFLAQAALDRVLTGQLIVDEEPEEEELKAVAQGALEAAFTEVTGDEETRKHEAQAVLDRILQDELEEAKLEARDALNRSLAKGSLQNRVRGGDNMTPEEIEAARVRAREALCAALLEGEDAKSAAAPPKEPPDREVLLAHAVQARLELAKDRMTSTNSILKDEVRRLTKNFCNLVDERDGLRSSQGVTRPPPRF